MPVRDLLLSATSAAPATYVEDVFSTYLYTGNGSTQTINNGIDLAGKGGLVWTKMRDQLSDHIILDTIRGQQNWLASNTTNANANNGSNVITYNSNGMSLGNLYNLTNSGSPIATWTFRKQPKFFDVVTYTGTGSNTTISHNLGSVPGMIIIKRTDTTADWQVYHSALANTEYMVLNTIAAKATGATRWNSTTPTSSVFSLGTDTTVNASGGTYVAYIYASNAGGFGTTGTDNVISCGSFTTDGSGSATVSLGYEPQWIIIKRTNAAGQWYMQDVMRGFNQTNWNLLYASLSNAENDFAGNYIYPTATGFETLLGAALASSATYIYMAIRRPMKVPTIGTDVYFPGINSTGTITTGFPVDLTINNNIDGSSSNSAFIDRLRGSSTTAVQYLVSSSTAAEVSGSGYGIGLDSNTTAYNLNSFSGGVYWNFKRASAFFDEVCYTGTGYVTPTKQHNLGVAPELIITKSRQSSTAQWWVGWAQGSALGKALRFNTDQAEISGVNFWNPTATTFDASASLALDASGSTYVTYLFATCAGVSKVGSYTGNGTTQAIACGFTGGARFVLIKRTDSTGDWYTYDTARGMTTLTDPYLLLNTAAAQTATLGSVTTTTGGFTVNASILSAINTSGASYIFLAIA